MAKPESIDVSFKPQQAELLAAVERARAFVREGADQLDRGNTVDGETFFREWDEELAALESAQSQNAE